MLKLECGPEDHREIVTIDIDTTKKIGLFLSGGIDSSVLLSCMCKDIIAQGKQPKDVIKYLFNIPKTDGAELYPPALIEFVEKKFDIELPSTTRVRITQLHQRFHGQKVWESILHTLENYDVDQIYMGDQRSNPDLDTTLPTRSEKIEGPMPGTLIFPFNHTQKSHTIDIMFQLGVEEISNLSHSCTETMTGKCGKCYHCKERAWAFESMDKVDTGNG
jgi:hypothetical protein